jgi:hypothetical protein
VLPERPDGLLAPGPVDELTGPNVLGAGDATANAAIAPDNTTQAIAPDADGGSGSDGEGAVAIASELVVTSACLEATNGPPFLWDHLDGMTP